MDLFYATSKIVSLARSGSIRLARDLFDKIPERDTVAWNAMLACYSQSGLSREALSLFSDMRTSGARPDGFSLTAALSASADVRCLSSGRKLHALAHTLGLHSSLPVCNALVDVYGKCSRPSSALRVFDEMSERNEVSWCSLLFGYVTSGRFEDARRLFGIMPDRKNIAWNMLITGYARFGEVGLSIDLFREMQVSGFKGDLWTFSGLMSACTELDEQHFGCMVQACIAKSGWSSAVEVNNSIMSFYARFGRRDDAVRIFDSLETRTLVSWNAMIDAHMRVGDVDEALSMFRRSPERNIISWTAMIGGFARNGREEDILVFYTDMLRSRIRPDEFTLGPVLQACANMAVLGHGRMVHGCVIRTGFDSCVYVGNGLVNMYAKCGDIGGSSRVFHGILSKDLVSWNAMLFGFALHGLVLEALSTYNDMATHRVSPDNVTFIGLLMACSHSGLLEQGCLFFKMMKSAHGLPPGTDHVLCMVDMLGRAGRLKEAHKLLEEYCSSVVDAQATDPCEALVGACAVHGDVGMGRKVGEELVTKEPQKEVGYVMLSNLYCFGGRWMEAEKVRKAMAKHGVKKVPGCSWIEVRNVVTVFATGTRSLPRMKHVHGMIHSLESEMRNPSFIGSNK